MLVLSRRKSETIVIDGGITVTVRKISGNRVTIAVEAPPEKRILRGEIADRVDDAESSEP